MHVKNCGWVEGLHYNAKFVTICRRRESVDVEDLFIAHIGGMDTIARGLRNAATLLQVLMSPVNQI